MYCRKQDVKNINHLGFLYNHTELTVLFGTRVAKYSVMRCIGPLPEFAHLTDAKTALMFKMFFPIMYSCKEKVLTNN